MGVWLGSNGRAENNLIHDIGYDGMWGSALKPVASTSGQVMTGNTIYRTGRGSIELSSTGTGTQNMDISYNDMYQFDLLSVDGGAIYAGSDTTLTGTRVH